MSGVIPTMLIRLLTVIDAFTRYVPAIDVRRSYAGADGIDGSILPKIPAANLQAPIMMAAERIADLMCCSRSPKPWGSSQPIIAE